MSRSVCGTLSLAVVEFGHVLASVNFFFSAMDESFHPELVNLPDLPHLVHLEYSSSEEEMEAGSHFGDLKFGGNNKDMLNKTLCEADFNPVDE